MPELSYIVSAGGEPCPWSVTDDTQAVASQFSTTTNNNNNLFQFTSTGSSGMASLYGAHAENNGLSNIINTAAATTNAVVGMDGDANMRIDGGGAEAGAEGDRWIWVLDPLTRKLRVPISQLVPTQATSTTGTVPSLCISFLEGRCRHPWCRQAHVLPSAIPQLRYEALNAPTCCRVHDDPHDTSVLTSRFKYIRVVNNSNNNSNSNNNGNNGNNNNSTAGDTANDTSDLISTDRVAQTVGLLRFMAHSAPPPRRRSPLQPPSKDGDNMKSADVAEDADKNSAKPAVTDDCDCDGGDDDRDAVLELPAKLICRLHLSHRCRYLEDCNNIHICREYEFRLHPPPHVLATLASVAPGVRRVTVGDTCYALTQLASGDVSDDEFKTICEQQRRAVASNAWAESPTLTAHRSPMIYGGSGASSFTGNAAAAGGCRPSSLTLPAGKWTTSTSNNNNNNMANSSLLGGPMLFPMGPENVPSNGNSPNMSALSLQGGGCGQPPLSSQPLARALRVYDVRPKVTQPNNTANSNNNNGSGANNSTRGGNIMKGSSTPSGGARNNMVGNSGGNNNNNIGVGVKHNGNNTSGGRGASSGTHSYHHTPHHQPGKHTAVMG